MHNYQTYVLPPNFSFVLSPSRGETELSDVILKEIEAVWEREKKERQGQLFNGKVLSLIEYKQGRVVAEFVEYKYFLAYVLKPSLRNKLGIKPLSLSCITRTSTAVLIGRRSHSVMQHPLWFELAPSGGIDLESAIGERIDVIGQALRELEEETGYLAKDVERMTPMALIYDSHTGIYEVGIEIIMPEKAVCSLVSTPEYDELMWIPNEEIPSFVKKNFEIIVPLSIHLLKNLSKYNFLI